MITCIRNILVILILTCALAHARNPLSEEEVKAAFIYHFINYTEWNDNSTSFNVCIPEDLVFRVRARNMLGGKEVQGRKIAVKNTRKNCHVLVTDNPARDKDIITIGPLASGALFEFRVINSKLKFAANLDKITTSDLKISSQLLKLAITHE